MIINNKKDTHHRVNIVVDVYEQELFGQVQYRVMRADGLKFAGAIQIDCPSQEEALATIEGEARREGLGPVVVHVHKKKGAKG